jgi:hypothetical protein
LRFAAADPDFGSLKLLRRVAQAGVYEAGRFWDTNVMIGKALVG